MTILNKLECIQCGSCTAVCPVSDEGLNPRKVQMEVKWRGGKDWNILFG